MNSNKKLSQRFLCFSGIARKKGVLGGIMSTFVATIVIIVLLLIFVLVSGVVKKFGGVSEGVSVPSEQELGLKNVFNYMQDFGKLVEARFKFNQNANLDIAIQEAGYG